MTTKTDLRWHFQNDTAIAEAVRHARIPLCISDANLADNPIVFANQAFMELTGYDEAEVIGRNCRFLQGKDTLPDSIDAVRKAIASQSVETVEIVNYRKDGSVFVNALQIGPITDEHGKLVYFFGSQLDISHKIAAEEQALLLAEQELIHRLRNIVNVMTVVIEMTAREETDPMVMSEIMVGRLRALSDAHLQTINRTDEQSVSMADLVTTILVAYAPKGERQFHLEGEEILLPPHLLSCLALGLHEFATNSVKHGALGEISGQINVTWTVEAGNLYLHWAEVNGPEVVAPTRQSGSKIVADLIRAVGGVLEMDFEESGLIVKVHLPL